MKSNLTRDEARARAELIDDVRYEVELDLTDEAGFRSETIVRFRCRRPGAATFLDLVVPEVRSVELNGARVSDAFDGTRVHLEGLAEENEVRVAAVGAYDRADDGVVRFVDPVDGLVYLYTDLEPFGAHRVYPCFDQPDLKGRFRFGVTVPEGWEVASNAPPETEPETERTAARWRFEETPPIPTYVTAVVAGHYHVAREAHGTMDLRLLCRRSLAEYLDPDEIFEITHRGLDFFEEAFGTPYPFRKYDQAFVPEYVAGAMENAGCVTFNESYIFRSRVTETQREYRAATILHEMAHMWFGDLVTMRWWDDLWLNETFATYASELALSSATRFTANWATFAHGEKAWASRQDQLPTSHPIVADVPDVRSAHLNFDGITYAKGASAIRQLVAWVGLPRFLEGMQRYFRRHEYGNAELVDFLEALEEASGRDLHAWSEAWLETPGISTLGAALTVEGDALASVALEQEPPEAHPRLRPHRVALGLYEADDGRLVRRRRVELDVVEERTEVPALSGTRPPDLLLVNDEDLTFAKVRLDGRSLRTVRERLSALADPLSRAVCWRALWELTRDAELPAREYLRTVLEHVGAETEPGVAQRLLGQAATAVSTYGDPSNRDAASTRLATGALELLSGAEPGSDLQLAYGRSFISAATSEEQLATARGLLDGSVTYADLRVDIELRWLIVRALAAAGVGDGLAEAELERDPTDRGRRHASAARASRPTPEAKAEAWETIVADETQYLATLEAIMAGFQRPDQEAVLEPYAERYFEVLPEIWERRDLTVALAFGEAMYPRAVVRRGVVDRTDAELEREDLPDQTRRILLEGRDDVLRALRARARDAAGA